MRNQFENISFIILTTYYKTSNRRKLSLFRFPFVAIKNCTKTSRPEFLQLRLYRFSVDNH